MSNRTVSGFTFSSAPQRFMVMDAPSPASARGAAKASCSPGLFVLMNPMFKILNNFCLFYGRDS